MVYRFTFSCEEGDPNFRRVFEADADATFLELHEAILKSVGYPDDQMTSFFLCNDEWEKGQEVTLVEMDSNFEYDNMVMNETRLSDLIEEVGQRLIYIFDPMFERYFFGSLKEIKPGAMNGVECVESKGKAPKQLKSDDPLAGVGGGKGGNDDFIFDSVIMRNWLTILCGNLVVHTDLGRYLFRFLHDLVCGLRHAFSVELYDLGKIITDLCLKILFIEQHSLGIAADISLSVGCFRVLAQDDLFVPDIHRVYDGVITDHSFFIHNLSSLWNRAAPFDGCRPCPLLSVLQAKNDKPCYNEYHKADADNHLSVHVRFPPFSF